MNSGADPREWDKYRLLRASDPDAAEKGRLLAAHEIANNPEARARVEEAIGVQNAALMYPEAYRDTKRNRGYGRFLDRLREAIPW